mgnify:CR=1 FL=1
MKKINKKQKLIIFIAIIMVLVIIGVILGAKVIKTNIANDNYNTANSNSSSGNLLPEYIKEGITLGGVTGTLVDLDTSDATATPEDIAYGKTAYVKGEKITGTYRTLKDLEIGDYVAYIPDSASNYSISTTVSGYSSEQTIPQESLNWRVLNINNDGTVDLISATPTTTSLYLKGATGYNNGVYLLNDIVAKQYSNSRLGVTARNLAIEDIEEGMTSDGLNYIYSYNSGYKKLGETATYTNEVFRRYPNLYAFENGSGIDSGNIKVDGINPSDSYYNSPISGTYSQAKSSLTVTQTYFYKSMSSRYYKNSTFFDLVHSGNGYWLATRYVDALSEYAIFGIRVVYKTDLSGNYLLNSYGTQFDFYYDPLRPIVSLKGNIRLGSGDGKSPETAFELVD